MRPASTPPASTHIVFVVRSFGFPMGTAATNRLRLIAHQLHQRGAEVTVICTRVTELPGQILNPDVSGVVEGIRYLYSPGTTVRSESFLVRRVRELRGLVVTAFEIMRLRRAGKLDCVFLADSTHDWEVSTWLLRRWLRSIHVPVVVQLTEIVGGQPRLPKRLSRIISHLDSVTGVIAISDWLARWAMEEASRIGRRLALIVVPILVDVSEQTPATYPADAHTFLFAASTGYARDLRYVLHAMEKVWHRHPDARLVITGMDSDWLAEIADEENVGPDVHRGRVTAPGYLTRQELLRHYAEASAMLAPLHDDDRSRARFPTKIGEYLAAGRPVVTTAVGEVEHYLHDGETAYISQTDDLIEFAAKMEEVLDDPVAAARIGASGREVALARFDADQHAEVLMSFFEHMTGR